MALRPTKGEGIHSEPYRLYNLDVFEYLHESPFGLYGSIPFMLGHSVAHGTSGVFWLNSAEMWVDVVDNQAEKDKVRLFGTIPLMLGNSVGRCGG